MDVAEELTPKSSVTLSAGYGIVHFYGDITSIDGTNQNITFIGSREETGQVAYDRILNSKDQVALSYGYQGFEFSTVDTAFHSSVIQAMYGHRISGRMDFLISAPGRNSPISTRIQLVCSILNVSLADCTADLGTVVVFPQKANHIGVAGRIALALPVPENCVGGQLSTFQHQRLGRICGVAN